MNRSDIRLQALEIAHRVMPQHTSIAALIAGARTISQFIEETPEDEDARQRKESASLAALHEDMLDHYHRMCRVEESKAANPLTLMEQFFGERKRQVEKTPEERAEAKEKARVLANQMTIASDFREFFNYVRVRNIELGTPFIRLFPFQADLLTHVVKNKHSIIRSARQMGLSTILSAFAVWKALSQNETVLVVTPKRPREMMERIVQVLDELPPDLCPKFTSVDPTQIRLSNGSSIRVIESCAELVGLMPTVLVLLDAAYFPHRCGRDLWVSLAPGMANAHVVMASTPNDTDGIFYHTWQNTSENGFAPLDLPWHLYPGRDESWKTQTQKVIGAENFSREYDCQFIKA